MAVINRKMFEVVSILVVTSLISPSLGDRVKQKIYIDLDTQSSCFRILNGTQEVGCASSQKGNVGTVHYIQDESDFDWILSKGPHDPYVALINGANFTGPIVRRLYKSSRVVGILVIDTINSLDIWPHYPWPEEGFSTQDQCPNDQYGLYGNDSEYKNCKKGNWNTAGTSLGKENINIPVFTLTSEKDVDNVLNKCFYPFNHNAKNKSSGYPVCAAEMRASMDGAVNSKICMRRSEMFTFSFAKTFCQPLGDHNIAATMLEKNDTVPRENDSVIMVAARLDSTSLFINQYLSADTSVAGIVTLLASAEALWKVRDTLREDPKAKDIMYTFFHGETFDYIGSSRMVYDMREKTFPPAPKSHSPKVQYLPQVKLPHINQIVELNQVGKRSDAGSLWAHTDPIGQAQPQVGKKIQQMISDLQSFSKDLSLSIQEADKDLPLPPASSQSFLKHRREIPTVVITDHKKAYTNMYYSSRFDQARFINADDYPPNSNASVKYDYVTRQAELISNLSTTLARYLYKASTGKEPSDEIKQNVTADSSLVTHLLYCFLVSPNCDLFLESIDESNERSLTTSKVPFPFYVSVMDHHTNEVTRLVYSLMARLTGQKMDLTKSRCKKTSTEERYSYVWMQGSKKPLSSDREGWCMRSTVFYSYAESPAFLIDGYDMSSGEYSTWTESVWSNQAFRVRIFLIPSPELQLLNLGTGLILLLVSLALIYLINNSADLIFTSSTPPQAV